MFRVVIGTLFLIGGVALILWGAERFTDGATCTATRFALSPFFVGVVVSGFEPENLVTGVAAAAGGLPQIALGTVIGSAVFLLTGALGLALLLVPMAVRIPRAGPIAMLAILTLFTGAVLAGRTVSRPEGGLLVAVAIGLIIWLYRRSPVFRGRADQGDKPHQLDGSPGVVRTLGLLVAGTGVMVLGAELVVSGVRTLLSATMLSETFLGMAVIGISESLEETARMIAPARRGHPELAWGNVVGTVVVLLGLNLGLIALIRPLTADPLVLRFHAPFLIGCTVIVAVALLMARRLGRGMGAFLIALCGVYLAVNLAYMWQ